MFFRCVLLLLAMSWRCGFASDCMPKSLIISDLAMKDSAIQIIKNMRELQVADARLSKALLAAVLHSNTRSIELQVPWNSNLTKVEELVSSFRANPFLHPAPQTTTTNPNASPTSPHHQAPATHDTPHKEGDDPLLSRVQLGLKFFRRNETGAILVLASADSDTNVSSASIGRTTVPVVIAYSSQIKHLTQLESDEVLKLVDMSENAALKQASIARFLLYSHCSYVPASEKDIQGVAGAGRGGGQMSSDDDESAASTSVPPHSIASADTSRKTTAITAGSVAAASAGVAAVSVFAGRWFQTASPSSPSHEGSGDDGHYPPQRGGAAGHEVLATPVPRERTSLDIDSHTPPDVLLRSSESPVQHISFTMF